MKVLLYFVLLTAAFVTSKSEDFVENIKEKINILPYLKESFVNNKELIDDPELIQTLEVPSISKYQQSIILDFSKGIKNEKHTIWIERIMNKLGLPLVFKETLDIMSKSDEKLKIVSFAWFNQTTNSSSYALILDNYYESSVDGKFNFIYAKVDTLIEKEITIIQTFEKNGTIIINNKKDDVSQVEAELYMEFFEIVALTKIANYIGIPIPEKVQYYTNPTLISNLNFLGLEAGPEDIADAAIKIANGVVDLFDKCAKVFGSSTSTSLKEIIKGEGFSKFSQNTRVDVNKGIKLELKEKYFDRIVQRLSVPANDRKDFLDFVNDVKDFGPEEKRFLANNFLFSSGEPSNPLKYLIIVFQEHPDTGKFDFFWSSVSISFALADDIFVMQTKKHSFGWDSDTIEFKRVPRNITPEDIKTVISYVEVVGINSLCKILGIPVLPPFN